MARLADGDPSLNAQLRTTCVATQVTAGHAPNALPQRARANVNCRILPGETPGGDPGGPDQSHRRPRGDRDADQRRQDGATRAARSRR